MDLQLQSWKEFEEQDLVIKLLIVDNSFCIMTELLCVYFWEFHSQTVSGSARDNTTN